MHRQIAGAEAKRLIDDARRAGALRGASQDDLLAPHEEKEKHQHAELCRVLGQHYGITMSLHDFVQEDDVDGEGGYMVFPLQFAEVDTSAPLLVVSCDYTLAKERQDGELGFDVEPDSVTFHLFEVVSGDTQTLDELTQEAQKLGLGY